MPATDSAPLDLLTAIMREAGELARAASHRPLRRWIKNGSSPVCEADIAVNDLLRQRLTAAAPGAAWLSEESEDDLARIKAAAVWVVDPIDGTRALLDGRADWTISVALVEGARPALAAISAPMTDEMFVAAAGHGASRNGKTIRASAGGDLDGARLAGPLRYLQRMSAIEARIQAQPKVFSLALRLARVAQGELDGAFASGNSRDWDLAAADLLVHEAGGALTDFNGQSLSYNRLQTSHGALLAAGHARHETLIDLVREHHDEFA